MTGRRQPRLVAIVRAGRRDKAGKVRSNPQMLTFKPHAFRDGNSRPVKSR